MIWNNEIFAKKYVRGLFMLYEMTEKDSKFGKFETILLKGQSIKHKPCYIFEGVFLIIIYFMLIRSKEIKIV